MSSSFLVNWTYHPELLPEPIMTAWQKLAGSTGQADPACCAPTWNLAFHDIFHPMRRIFHMYANNSLALFGEYRSQAGDVYMMPLEDSWMFGQPLLGHDAPDLLLEATSLFSREYAPKFPQIVLSGIRESHPATHRLFRLFSNRYNFYRYNSTVQCSASLAGGLDGWLGRRSANHRAKLKKSARKAADLNILFERHRPKTAQEAASVYERMLNVELKSWKGAGHCGMAESPSREFYGALLARHARNGTGLVIFARQEDKDIGFIFGGLSGAAYRGQQFSYDMEFARISPGNLLQLEKVRWLCELGCERYDMGPITGPRMGYKEHWTESLAEIETWIMRKQF